MSDSNPQELVDARWDLLDRKIDLDAERKAHEATRQEKLLAEAQLEYAMARLVSPARAEIAEQIAEFWEAEAARGRALKVSWGSDQSLWEEWDGSTGDDDRCYVPGCRPVPRIVWWHAHRRTR